MADEIEHEPNWQQRAEEAERNLLDAAILIRRLAYLVPPEITTRRQADDWLVRKGLTGSILRDSGEATDGT